LLTFATINGRIVNLSFFIASRYLVAKKSHNLINIISAISVVGVGVGTFALIVVLSVFNGFEQVISGLVNDVSPHLLIEPRYGKTIDTITFPAGRIRAIDGIGALIEVAEEDALFRYRDKQHIGRIKGVGSGYCEQSHFASLISSGDFILQQDGYDFAVVGAGVAWFLGVNVKDPTSLLTVYLPRRGKASVLSFEQSFSSNSIQPLGVFSSQQEFDARYVLVPVEWARSLLGYTHEVSTYEIFLSEPEKLTGIQKDIIGILGPDFKVKDRFQQQETLYRIMRSEKWAIFIILTFILIMATFNVIGSLTMVILDKRKDISVLSGLGAAKRVIQKLFLTEGILISLAGGVAGLFLGVVVVLLQQHFGWLKLGGDSGSFIIDAYPVNLKLLDVIAVFVTVASIGLLSSAYTVRQALRRLQSDNLKNE